jgi:hypothetical protein
VKASHFEIRKHARKGCLSDFRTAQESAFLIEPAALILGARSKAIPSASQKIDL